MDSSDWSNVIRHHTLDTISTQILNVVALPPDVCKHNFYYVLVLS